MLTDRSSGARLVQQYGRGRPGGDPVNIKSTSWLAVAVLQMGMAGDALAAIVYTNRALFEAALNPDTVTIETFEDSSYETVDTPDQDIFLNPTGKSSQTLDYFSVETDPAAIKIFEGEHTNSHNTTTGGNQFLYLDTDLGLQGVITADILPNQSLLDQSLNAFGFDYTGVLEPGTVFTVTIDQVEYTLTNNPGTLLSNGNFIDTESSFWGIIGVSSIDKITLYTSSDSAYGVDDVIFGSAVPLPPAFWLFGSGLLALAGGARKGKAHS
jgi:hypothetical protein